MKIIIDINKTDYTAIKNYLHYSNTLYGRMFNSIKHGIVLPENHGDLIDKDAIVYFIHQDDGYYADMDQVNEISPIIEADKENGNV